MAINEFSIGFNATANGNIGSVTAEYPTGAKLAPTKSNEPDVFTVYPADGGIATAGPQRGGTCLGTVDLSTDNQSVTVNLSLFDVYNSVGESQGAFGDVGPVVRGTYVATYQAELLYSHYRAYYRFSNQTLHVERLTVDTTTNPGFPFYVITNLYTAALAAPLVKDANRYITLEVTGTNPVLLDVKENGTSLLTAPIQDSSASRLTTGKKFGGYMSAPNGNPPGMRSLSADTISAAASPVSFSGTVPTRNGIVGSAVSFVNAGFFAGGNTPFSYTSVGTTLPAGLTLSSSTGIISGTPTTAATTSGIIIRATDTATNVANTNSYSIVIAATNASPTFPGSISNVTGTNGTSITPVNVSGQFSDTDTLTYSASPSGTAWPSGITISSSTGVISGTSSTTATTTGCKVRATDTASQVVDSNAFNFVIAAPSSGVVFAASGQLKNLNGAVLPDGTYTVTISSLTSHGVTALGVKTGLAMVSGSIPQFSISGPVSGVEYEYKVINEANPLIRGLARATGT